MINKSRVTTKCTKWNFCGMNNWKLTHVILWLRHRIDLYNSQMNVPLANRCFKRILISFNQLPDLGNFVIIRCPCCNPCLIVKDKMVGLFKYNVTWSCLSVIRNFKFEFDRFIYMCIDCGVSRYLRWFIFCKSICVYISKIGTNYFNDQKKCFSKFGLAYFLGENYFEALIDAKLHYCRPVQKNLVSCIFHEKEFH